MTDRQFILISKAFADPRRFAILQVVAESRSEVMCKKLLERFRVTPATMSHHLKELINAGLIEGRKETQFMYLSARRDVIAAYRAELSARLG